MRVYILIAVDVAGALAAGTLQGYVYLVDTNQYIGSWQEGQSTLNTVCQDGQALCWSAVSVDPGSDVAITGFTGPMVDQKVCQPVQDTFAEGSVWNGQVEAHGEFASFAYSVTLSMGGRSMGFSAFLKVV